MHLVWALETLALTSAFYMTPHVSGCFLGCKEADLDTIHDSGQAVSPPPSRGACRQFQSTGLKLGMGAVTRKLCGRPWDKTVSVNLPGSPACPNATLGPVGDASPATPRACIPESTAPVSEQHYGFRSWIHLHGLPHGRCSSGDGQSRTAPS